MRKRRISWSRKATTPLMELGPCAARWNAASKIRSRRKSSRATSTKANPSASPSRTTSSSSARVLLPPARSPAELGPDSFSAQRGGVPKRVSRTWVQRFLPPQIFLLVFARLTHHGPAGGNRECDLSLDPRFERPRAGTPARRRAGSPASNRTGRRRRGIDRHPQSRVAPLHRERGLRRSLAGPGRTRFFSGRQDRASQFLSRQQPVRPRIPWHSAIHAHFAHPPRVRAHPACRPQQGTRLLLLHHGARGL